MIHKHDQLYYKQQNKTGEVFYLFK